MEALNDYISKLYSAKKDYVRILFFDLETQMELLEPVEIEATVAVAIEQRVFHQSEQKAAFDVVCRVLQAPIWNADQRQGLLFAAITYFHKGRQNQLSHFLWSFVEIDAIHLSDLPPIIQCIGVHLGRITKDAKGFSSLHASAQATLCFLNGDVAGAITLSQNLKDYEEWSHYFYIYDFLVNRNYSAVKELTKSSDPQIKLFAWLLSHAYPTKASKVKLASPKYLANKGGYLTFKNTLEAAGDLERLFAGEKELTARSLSELLKLVSEAESVIGEVLLIAGLITFVKEKDLKLQMNALRFHYQQFFEYYSKRRDIDPMFLEILPEHTEPKARELPVNRSLIFNKRNIHIGQKYINYRLRSFLSDQNRQAQLRQNLFKDIAAYVAQDVRNLRGGVAKMAQVGLSFQGMLPQEVVEELKYIFDQCQSISTETTKALLRKELGDDPSIIFSEFELNPIKNGSMGQIHKARLHSGERVVVKVRYPGIEKAIKDDFRSLMRIEWLVSNLIQEQDIEGFFERWRKQALAECDFQRELHSTEFAKQILSETSHVRVPKVFRSFSNQNILVLEYLEGVRIDDLKSEQSTKNAIGEALLRSYLELQVNGMHRTDVHLGNYLVDGDSLGVIDFGGVLKGRELEGFNFFEIMASTVKQDPSYLKDKLIEWGWADQDIPLGAVQRFIDVIGRPFIQKFFKFDHKYVKEVFNYMTTEVSGHIKLPTAHMGGVRLFWSLYHLLAILQAESDWQAILKGEFIEDKDAVKREKQFVDIT